MNLRDSVKEFRYSGSMDDEQQTRSQKTVPQALGRLRVALEDTYTQASRELGLTAQQAELLCAAMRPAAVGEIAHILRCDRSNVSRLVDRAARRGLVSRRGADTDGRVTVIELTPDGQRLAHEFIHKLESRLAPLLAQWSDKQQHAAVATLTTLADALQGPREPAPAPSPAPLTWAVGGP